MLRKYDVAAPIFNISQYWKAYVRLEYGVIEGGCIEIAGSVLDGSYLDGPTFM